MHVKFSAMHLQCTARHAIPNDMAPLDSAVASGDMPAETSKTIQITLRIQKDWPTRADRLAPLLARPGMAVGRSDVLRMAIARGFEALEAEHGLGAVADVVAAPVSKPKPKQKRTRA